MRVTLGCRMGSRLPKGRLRVVGKGGWERVVPVDAAFFAELGAYPRCARPPGLATAACFVVLRGPCTGERLPNAATSPRDPWPS